jgi:hypothetical protein
MSKANTYSDACLSALPGTLQLRLYTATPTRSSAGTELVGTGYAPAAVTLGAAAAGTIGRRRTATANVVFTNSGGTAWASVVAAAVTDTSGNIQFFLPSTTDPKVPDQVAFTAQVINPSGTLTFNAAQIFHEEYLCCV